MRALLTTLSIILFPVFALGNSRLVEIQVKMGHKTSKIEITKKPAGSRFSFQVTLKSNDGVSRQTDLSKENFDHLKKKLNALGSSNIDKSQCRDYEIAIDDYTQTPAKGYRHCHPATGQQGQLAKEFLDTVMLLF